ncbi:MAG TPA: hypothetical protein VH639_20140 [Bryobacteraceae bacterium]
MWRSLDSLFKRIFPAPAQTPAGVAPIVVISADDRDRRVLMDMSAFPVYFAESPQKASAALEWLRAPVALFDRDWPGIEWRAEVQRLSSSRERPCVILMSSVIDDYLWEEVVRCGGYDVVAKPLEPEHLARVIGLALSYRKVAPQPPRTARIS